MGCFLREQLNHLLVVLVSIPVCLLFLSILSHPDHLKQFNCYLHIPSFKCLLSDMSSNIFSLVVMIFSIDLQDAYLHITIVKHHCCFLMIRLVQYAISVEGFTFWPGHNPRFFTALTKPILFLCHHKGFHIVISLDDILVLVHSKWAGKRAHSFLCSLLVCLGLLINFSKSDLHLTQTFCFFGLCWDTVHMSVSLHPDKLADIQQLALSLLQTQPVTVHQVMSFLGKANFCANGHCQLWRLCHVIQSEMLTVYHSPGHLISPVCFSFSALHQLELLSHLKQSPVPLQFLLPDVVIATDATSTHWAFYFQGSALPLSVSHQVYCLGSYCLAEASGCHHDAA